MRASGSDECWVRTGQVDDMSVQMRGVLDSNECWAHDARVDDTSKGRALGASRMPVGEPVSESSGGDEYKGIWLVGGSGGHVEEVLGSRGTAEDVKVSTLRSCGLQVRRSHFPGSELVRGMVRW